MFDFAIAGCAAPIFLLVLVGVTVGMVGGFIGVGGALKSTKPSKNSATEEEFAQALEEAVE